MLQKPSLLLRTATGKSVGFIVGLIVFFIVPMITPEISLLFRWGLVFYLTLMGGFIGILGVMTYHPVLHMPLPWWVRGPMVGGFMMLILWMLAQTELDAMAIAMFGENSIFSSGVWSIIDGLVLGALMSFLATRFGGEGKETVGQ